MSLCATGQTIFLITTNPYIALWCEKTIVTMSFSFATVFLLIFTALLTERQFIKNKFIIASLFILPIANTIINSTTNWYTKSVNINNRMQRLVPGDFYNIYLIIILIYSLASIFIAVKYLTEKNKNPLQRKKVKYFAFAISIPVIGGIITEVLPVFFIFNAPPMTAILSGFPLLVIGYILIKYGEFLITPQTAAESIIKTMPGYLFVLNKDKKIVAISDSITNKLGYEQKEIIGKDINNIMENKENGGQLKIIDILENSELKDYDVDIYMKNKEIIPVQAYGSTLKHNGEIQGYVIIMINVSELKKAVNNLNEKAKELEKSKQELEEKNKELKKFNEIAIGRELMMVELKRRIEELEKR